MRKVKLQLLSVAVLIAISACGSPDDAGAPERSPEESAPSDEVTKGTQAEKDSRTVEKKTAETTFPEVSRTRTGNGGVIALAGETTFEFDYAPSHNRCEAAAGKFKAKGADLDNAGYRISIEYAIIIDPNSGRSIGPAFQLEVRVREDEVWATYVGGGMAGKIEEISQTESTGGGTVLTVTGIASGFRNNGASIGRKVPFRLEATCE